MNDAPVGSPFAESEGLPLTGPRRTRRKLALAIVGVLCIAITAALFIQFRRGDRSPFPDGRRLFTRTTHAGLRVSLFTPSGDEKTSGGSCFGGTCPPCVLYEDAAVTFNGKDYGGVWVTARSSGKPVLVVVDIGGGGGPNLPAISWVVAFVSRDVMRVRAQYSGVGDEMAPVKGWAVLAIYGNPALKRVEALDASGRVLASAESISQASECEPSS